jgi:Flp pilus assembly protein TadB
MENEKPMTEQDSLQLIQQMILTARNEHKENGLGWIVWGWILIFCASFQYIVIQFNLYIKGQWIWYTPFVLGVLFMVYLGRKNKKNNEVKTYSKTLLTKIMNGFFISLTVMIIMSYKMHQNSLPFFLTLYAFWMFIYGSAISFKPLIYGACINWFAALLITFIDFDQHVLLVMIGAVLFGYLVPGYMLQHANKKAAHV